jgi:RNA 3'-terminal phosphate cyclase (ATP)
MILIDGSQGEGGGQIVRSSLALSLVTGRAVKIDNIRAGRPKPGLMRQHLAAVQAAAEVTQAEVTGATVGSRSITFRPRGVRSGDYHFRIGTAGSTTLVLQTVLPALVITEGQSELTLEGGTHNPWAPPFDFLARTFFPLLSQMGPRLAARLDRYGFYPAAGGKLTVRIDPSATLRRLELVERGEISSCSDVALIAKLPLHIAERELRTIGAKTNWPPSCFRVEQIADSSGPGNAVIIEVASPTVTEVFTAFGRYGVRAERVADEALEQALAYLDTNVPVGPYLADQLLLPLGIAAAHGDGGGKFRTLPLTSHSTTHIEILRRFLDVEIHIEKEDTTCLVSVGP